MLSPSVLESPNDRRTRVDFAPADNDLGRQRSSEFGGSASLVGWAIDPRRQSCSLPTQETVRAQQRRRDRAPWITWPSDSEQLLYARHAAVERLLVAVEVEDAAFAAAIVVDRLVGHDLLEDSLRK